MHNRFYNDWDREHLRTPRVMADEHRSPFQVDRDRVLFSYAFRRLQSKTQVFQSGEYDFYRTRLTHTIEVARISCSICDYLKSKGEPLGEDFYIDSNLVEAVGYAHDLGHPPFGHIGERKLNELMAPYGGFEGNAQTARILTELIYERDKGTTGMNPTRAFLDGVMKYKALRHERVSSGESLPEHHFIYDEQEKLRIFLIAPEQWPDQLLGDPANKVKSIECQIMDWADDTAYSNHDIADGIQAGFITVESLERWAGGQSLTDNQQATVKDLLEFLRRRDLVESRYGKRLGAFIHACRLETRSAVPNAFLAQRTNRHAFNLVIDPLIKEECRVYKQIAVDLIFHSPKIQQIEFKGGHILDKLFSALYENAIHGADRPLDLIPAPNGHWIRQASSDLAKARLLCDYLTGLTDANALRLYKRLFMPDFGVLADIG
ncbi:MAG: dNTP triphosphohydrolase [Verrucomicrobiota bacterium]|nr:dNTP triphosphohydrolase [Verrucomicrobiota bacterium]